MTRLSNIQRGLSEVCQIQPPKSEARLRVKPTDEVTFAPMETLGIGRKNLLGTTERRLSEVAGSYTYFADNDVLLAKITPCFENGKVGIASGLKNGVGFGSSEYIVFRPSEALLSDYLYYFLSQESFRAVGEKHMTGAAGQKRITRTYVESCLIPVPGLDQQERTVAILDEAFEGIARAKRNAEQNFLNAQSIFDDSVKALITSEDLEWPLQTLGQICQVERGSSPRPIKNYFTTASDGVNWIKIGDTVEGEKYIHTTKQRITAEGAKQSRFVQEGDFVLTNSMSFGRSYIMKTSGYIHDGWFVLRLKSSIDRDYLYYLLTSKYIRDQFNELASGSVVLNISGDLVKRAKLPVPPIKEQLDLVGRLDTLAAETKNLQAIYERKIMALEALKQSLLNAAFSGNL